MSRAFVVSALLLLASWPGMAEPAGSKDANVPFSSFAALDERLTDLQEQFRALQASLQPEEKELARTRAWRPPAKKLRADIRSIERTAHRLRLYYRHSKWGRRAFLALEKKAQRMGRDADRLVQAHTLPVAKAAREALSREMLPLIVQFQAITTNYGTLHCDAGQTACCQPKKREAAESIPEHECKWVCVESQKACRQGITGPTAR